MACLQHQGKIVHQHHVKDTSLQLADSSKLSASFIIVPLHAVLSSESAHVQPTRLVTFLCQLCWSQKKALFDFLETLWLGHWEAWKPVTQPWQNLMPSEMWQTVTCNIHLWPFLVCKAVSLDLILFACVNGRGQENHTNTDLMEGGKRLLKAEQSAMAFAGFFLAKDSLHLKLPRK